MINLFDIHYGRVQQAGSNTRLELKKDLRETLTHRGVDLAPKTQVPMAIMDEEEEGCVVVKLYFRKEQQLAREVHTMHRKIVRAAMNAPDVECIGDFNRVSDDEYGYYVYLFEQDEAGFVASLDEDEGGIEEFENIDEAVEILERLKQELSHDGDIEAEVDGVIEDLRSRNG